MRDLIKSLPAMHDLANQAGIELPSVLGKVDNGIEDIKVAADPVKEKPKTQIIKKEEK